MTPHPRAIIVGKPHITLVRTGGCWPTYVKHEVWRCRGPFGGQQYGPTPAAAYAAWRRVLEHPTWRTPSTTL